MLSKKLILQNIVIFVVMLVFNSNNLFAQTGYWKLSDIKSENKDAGVGSVKKFVEGEIGNLVYTHEFGSNGWKVKATWDKMPEILIPEKKVMVGYQIDIIDYQPPAHHWAPSATFNFTDYWVTNSFDKKRTHHSLETITLEPKKLEHKKGNVNINPPKPVKDQPCYYIIRLTLKSLGTYYYIYEWQNSIPPTNDNVPVPAHSVWKLSDIKSENKDAGVGSVKKFVEGEIGNLVYTHEFGSNGWKVKATWNKMPEILIPEKKVMVGYQIDIIDYQPPAHHWIPSATFNFTDYWVTNSFDMKRTHHSLETIILEPKKLEHKKGNVNINPPKPEKSQPCYYIIRVALNSLGTYYYIYKWQE